jgi:hypothetical protein
LPLTVQVFAVHLPSDRTTSDVVAKRLAHLAPLYDYLDNRQST